MDKRKIASRLVSLASALIAEPRARTAQKAFDSDYLQRFLKSLAGEYADDVQYIDDPDEAEEAEDTADFLRELANGVNRSFPDGDVDEDMLEDVARGFWRRYRHIRYRDVIKEVMREIR